MIWSELRVAFEDGINHGVADLQVEDLKAVAAILVREERTDRLTARNEVI